MAAKSISSSLVPGKPFPQQTEPPTLLEAGRVSSLALAEHFGIKHQHVMRDIRAMLGKVPTEWGLSNFGQSTYHWQNSLNDQSKEQPAYTLTRDAFTLLAMGYNSPRAIAWKLRYIAAFNALERAVAEHARQSALESGARLAYALSPAGKRRMNQAARWRKLGLGVGSIAKLLGVNGREVSQLLKAAAALGKLPPKEAASHAAV